MTMMGPRSQKAVAPGLAQVHSGAQSLFLQFRLDPGRHFPAAGSVAGRSRTEGDAGLLGVSPGQDFLSPGFQFGG